MHELTLTSFSGFIVFISLYLYLLLRIQAVFLGSSIISKEERDKTDEYLFALPISRRKIIASKTVAAIINLIILNIITFSFLILSTISYKKGEEFYRITGLIYIYNSNDLLKH